MLKNGYDKVIYFPHPMSLHRIKPMMLSGLLLDKTRFYSKSPIFGLKRLSTEAVIGQLEPSRPFPLRSCEHPLVLELDLVFETIVQVSQGLDPIYWALAKRANPVTCIQHGGHLTGSRKYRGDSGSHVDNPGPRQH
jgi:hypothetical protein